MSKLPRKMITMYNRGLLQCLKKGKKSVLLLGPRQTGKSTLIKLLKPELVVNLAKEETFTAFLRDSTELESRLNRAQPSTVFIDEIQRIPSLLNTIQSIVDENSKIKFFLTGSSARKLRRGAANLLPGRIHSYQLSGLTLNELGDDFELSKALRVGTLPGIYLEDASSAIKTLRSYTSAYLREEIQAEALTKNLEGFARFLSVICAYCCQHIDFSKIAKQAQVSRSSVTRYIEILEDTLIAESVYAYQTDLKKRLIQHPKLYFFDVGVLNSLLENFEVSNERIGFLFENFVYSQLRACSFAKDKSLQIYNYRTEHGAEVDFILKIDGEYIALEVKSTKNINQIDRRGFQSFEEAHGKKVKKIVVYAGSVDKSVSGISLLSLKSTLKEIGL